MAASPAPAAPSTPAPSALDAVPAPAFFVAGAVSQYVGAALAVTLFPFLGPAAVAWIRVGSSGLFLWALRGRPRWRAWARARQLAIVTFGLTLAAMNLCFYLAVDRLPLGNAVAIEFLGPIVVAVLGARTARNAGALVLAVAGVALVAEVQWAASPVGVGLALSAAVLWAGYIVLGGRVARGGTGTADGLDALAWAMLLGSLGLAPLGVAGLVNGRPDAVRLVACAAVGLLSNVVPYGLDQVVLTRLAPSQFALLLALLPVTAAGVGAVVLHQVPGLAEVAGMALVVLAVAVRQR